MLLAKEIYLGKTEIQTIMQEKYKPKLNQIQDRTSTYCYWPPSKPNNDAGKRYTFWKSTNTNYDAREIQAETKPNTGSQNRTSSYCDWPQPNNAATS